MKFEGYKTRIRYNFMYFATFLVIHVNTMILSKKV